MQIGHVSTCSSVDEGFTGPRCVPYIATGPRRSRANQEDNEHIEVRAAEEVSRFRGRTRLMYR